ncbi:MAG: type III pantothenate kinase [Bacteroidales bacterium]|jgi:type III pantothenate kinase|nr:type III pantothenate kinase [Bacteroidales bacterium]MDD4703380.1 type III pantothenate kinase [Bacteroidales bacterium]MDX9797986.1 type III pantothenate kinase [Bacteroidales bacterium]
MNLVVDIGNTRTKIGVFHNRDIVYYEAFYNITAKDIEKVLLNFPNTNKSIISSVGKLNTEFKDFLHTRLLVLEFNNQLKVPITNKYTTISTLGKDRLAGVVGVRELFPNTNCLVIDAGSCITIDLIDNKGVYYGGSISPGINMKYKALNTFTSSLPLLIDNFLNQEIIGNSTDSSIISGVMNGTVMELKGFIDYYTNRYSDLKVIFTGGDSKILQNYFLENTLLEEQLVLLGLNIILDTNA